MLKTLRRFEEVKYVETAYNSSENPKDMCLTMIIKALMKIDKFRWYFPPKPLKAVKTMRAIISDLDEKSKRKLKKIYDRLTVLQENISLYSGREFTEIYAELMRYLHATYFRNLFIFE